MTTVECERWFKDSGVRIIHDRYLEFASESTAGSISTGIPIAPLRLNYFAIRVTEWLPHGRSRVLWMRTWDTNPPSNLQSFEHVRLGFGENRPLIEAPGHLFQSGSYADCENKTEMDRMEDAALSGFVLLMMRFGWEGYALAEGGQDFVFFGDETIQFSSADKRRRREAERLVEEFGPAEKRAIAFG